MRIIKETKIDRYMREFMRELQFKNPLIILICIGLVVLMVAAYALTH